MSDVRIVKLPDGSIYACEEPKFVGTVEIPQKLHELKLRKDNQTDELLDAEIIHLLETSDQARNG